MLELCHSLDIFSMSTINDLLEIIKNSDKERTLARLGAFGYFRRKKNAVDPEIVHLAYEFAKEAHAGQVRTNGEPYVTHCLETAIILAKMNMDQDTIVAGLLHDVPEDTTYSLVDVKKNFGKEVALLVAGITKLGVIKYRGIQRYAENLRRMFVSMAKDVRIVIIKMADRIHNLQTLDALRPDKQKRIAQESLEIYAPIANRLGISVLKGMIEDLSFPYVHPEEYAWFVKEIEPRIQEEIDHVDSVITEISKVLKKEKIKVLSIHGREKRIYSLYTKLLRPEYNKQLDKIHDLVALRIIVPDIAACYNVLGIVHKEYTPIVGRIKDYIAQPKPNGYQSLHTTVQTRGKKRVEFQIRTQDMHSEAEYGVAAHWMYKEKDSKQKSPHPKGYVLPKKYEWINELVDWQRNINDTEQYLDSLRVDFFHSRIFVLTPKGDVIDLPAQATPVDFAYHVHTWIGDHATAAKVNGMMVSLDKELQNGDVVEIITDKNRKGPSRDWLTFVKTQTTKSKIKAKALKH